MQVLGESDKRDTPQLWHGDTLQEEFTNHQYLCAWSQNRTLHLGHLARGIYQPSIYMCMVSKWDITFDFFFNMHVLFHLRMLKGKF